MGVSETVKGTGKISPSFRIGDTVVVEMKVIEGERERIQAFEGVVIRRRGSGVNETFTVRRVSHGEGIERIFPMRSPMIHRIEILKRGEVHRSKLYYLRKATGKKGRIQEAKEAESQEPQISEESKQPALEEVAGGEK